VHASIHDAFIAKSVAKAKARTVGSAFSGAEQGPQVDVDSVEKIARLCKAGVDEGARLECGGAKVDGPGNFWEPTIFSNVGDDFKIAKEEIFGPVMCVRGPAPHASAAGSRYPPALALSFPLRSVFKFNDIEEAITRANNSCYGLAAAVFTKDLDVATTVSIVRSTDGTSGRSSRTIARAAWPFATRARTESSGHWSKA